MQIDLTKKEFRRLLDMVYIGNWILNSTRGDDRFADYDDVESKLFALCREAGMPALVEKWEGADVPSRAFADGGIHEAIVDYEDTVFYEILAEELARREGGEHQIALAQRVTDFVAGRASGSLPATSYIPGVTPSRLDRWMPGFIAQGLRQGIATFGRRMRGYLTNEAVVVGVESRTSTPVRVPRDPGTLMHPETKGLFPAGEGAGYAGGIISAALDGERIAEAVKNYIR